ncbi:MAG: hypothetical protein GX937_02830 [Lentisphaerae bacterium]|jgi:hypothetical protein|nr:hypothetical protein [Lentisphaerota bacterium]
MIDRVGNERFGDGPALRPVWLSLQQASDLCGICVSDLRWLGYFNKVPCLRGRKARPLMIRHQTALDLRGKRCEWRKVRTYRRRHLSVPFIMPTEPEEQTTQ